MKRIWLCIAAGVALGEVLAYICRADSVVSAAIVPAAVFVCAFSASLLHRRHNTDLSPCRKLLVFLIVFSVSLSLGWFRMGIEQYRFKGALSPEVTVSDISIKNGRTVLKCGRLLVYAGSDCDIADGLCISDIRIGNLIRITGDITETESARNPGEFDYKLYYMAEGVTHRCFADAVTVIDDSFCCFRQWLYQLRSSFIDNISAVFDADDAGFMQAALLGDKSLISDGLYALYRSNGIAHLLAISGLHVSILGMTLYNLLRRLRLGYGVCGIISGSLLSVYGLLTGNGTSTIRAVLMLLLVFLAEYEGRTYDLLNSAGLAAAVMLSASPYQIFSCSFLLSFGAVIAIGGPASDIISLRRTVLKQLEETGSCMVIKANRQLSALAESLIVSTSVQMITLPITAYFFFEVSLYGVLLNLIVIPLMTYVLFSGMSALLLSILYVPAGIFAGGLGHYILYLYRLLCTFTGKLPFSTVLIGRPSLWQIGLYYSVLFSFLYLFPFAPLRRK